MKKYIFFVVGVAVLISTLTVHSSRRTNPKRTQRSSSTHIRSKYGHLNPNLVAVVAATKSTR